MTAKEEIINSCFESIRKDLEFVWEIAYTQGLMDMRKEMFGRMDEISEENKAK